MDKKLIASSATKDGLQKLINEFYYSESYIITDDLKVYNKKQQKFHEDKIIEFKNNRYRFYI